MFPTSPMPKPSTKTFPDVTCPVNFASFSFSSSTFPFSVKNMFSGGTPIDLAVSACAINCLNSP